MNDNNAIATITEPVLFNANVQKDVQTEPPSTSDGKLRRVAEKLEATFLAEMLKHSGVGETSESFGGGIGEDQFGSFLRQAQADEMAKTGGIGLAEELFEALKEKNNGIL